MSQKADIWNRLRRGYSISPLQALTEFGCFRLAARICELRREGKAIIGEPEGNYFVYRAAATQLDMFG